MERFLPMRGGKRVGAGRKAIAKDSDTRRHHIILDDKALRIFKNFGKGNLSAGMRIVARAFNRIDEEYQSKLIKQAIYNLSMDDESFSDFV